MPRSQPSLPASDPSAPAIESTTPDLAPRRLRPPLFHEPDSTSPDPSLEATTQEPGDQGYVSDSGPDEPKEDRGRSAPRGSSRRELFDGKDLAEAIEGGVIGVSVLMHENLTRDDLERDAELYIADEADAKNLSQPLAGIAERRMGAAARAASPDLADAVAAAIALAVYITKQLKKWSAIRRIRRGVPAQPDPVEQTSTSA